MNPKSTSFIRKVVKCLLKEDPDTLTIPYMDGYKTLLFSDKDTMCFGYVQDVLFIHPRTTHYFLYDIAKEYFEENEGVELPEFEDSWDSFHYAGRIWLNEKIISFWEFPETPQKFKDIIDHISEEIGGLIDDDWLVEAGNYKENLRTVSNLYTIKEFITYWDEIRGSIPKDIESKEHIKSPLEKGIKTVPDGMGSRKKYKDMEDNETMAQYHARTQLDENVTKELLKIRRLMFLGENYLKNDLISGGKGDKTNPESIDIEELTVGIAVEKEHTIDDNIAHEIATDHLTENPKYYSELIKSGLVDEEYALALAKKFGWIE